MSRILVTGGLGFVGGRVAIDLAADRKSQVVLTTRKAGLSQVEWLPEAEVRTLDLLSDESCFAACQGIDTIIHLAAANEIDSGKDPQNAMLVTGLGSLKLLQAAQTAKVKRFIYFSTAHVYRAPLVGCITEECLPRPAHPYAITHKAAEDFVLAAGDCSSLRTLVLRLSNSFGAPAHADVNRWSLIVNDLCRQAVTTGKLVLRSAGLQWRNFIALNDVTRAVSHFLSSDVGWDNGIFNLGGESALRMIDIAERIQERCPTAIGYRPEILRPAPNANESSEYLDYRIDKLKNTGFKLRDEMSDEIDATLKLCQKAFGQ